jgi:phosphohistidine phosphatase SixA
MKRIGFLIPALVLLCAGFPASAQSLSGAPLVAALRQGGYVFLMRHAHAPNGAPEMPDPENSARERQLDDAGRAAAKAFGDALRALKIPVGTVLSSPTYRAQQTIRLAALGTPQLAPQLGEGAQGMAGDAGADKNAWLRTKVAEKPPAGSNTILITHVPNITGAFPSATGLKDGEALIFHPDGKGGAELVARVEMEEWPALAK